MQPTPVQVIRQFAPHFGLDWRAVRAYMLEESGGRWDAVGDHGTSFGPFQEHRGGALGQHTPQWAMSPAGLVAGMRMMAQGGAAGKHGEEALWAIYEGFGKGSDNQGAFKRAQQYLDGGGQSAPYTPGGSPTAPSQDAAGQAPAGPDLRSSLLSALQAPGGISGGGLLHALLQAGPPQQQAAPASLHDVAPGAKTTTTTLGSYPSDFTGRYPSMVHGGKSPYSNLTFSQQADWQHVDSSLLDRLNILGRRLGVVVNVISGYRSPGYSARVGGYGTDPHTRGVAVDAYVNGTPIGDVKNAVQLLHELGLESGAQPNFYHGKPDPEHVQVPGSGVNKRIHARKTHAPWK